MWYVFFIGQKKYVKESNYIVWQKYTGLLFVRIHITAH